MIILPQWLICDARKPPLEGWGVRIIGDHIDIVAANGQLRTQFPNDEVFIANNQVLAPGFVNAHTHLYGILAHGIMVKNPPSGFYPFLKEFWWPKVEDKLDIQMICAASELRCTQMLKSGVTSFYDVTEAPHALPGVLSAQCDVIKHHGIRGVLSFEATQRVNERNGQLGIKENAEFIKSCEKENGLISGIMCFHTSFTCSSDFIREAFELGQNLGVLTHMHCAEGIFEPDYTIGRFGKRTLHYYDDLGVVNKAMLASQCVQIDQTEIELIAQRGVRVVHMPLSNCEVGGGIAPLPELITKGVTIGLGSDGYIEDFFDIMRGAFLIHKANCMDPQVIPADTVWYLATEGGARAIGLDKVGRIEPGWQADLQLIDCQLPTPILAHNLYEQLLLYRDQSHVRSTMVAGKFRVRDGVLLDGDIDLLVNAVKKASQKLWSS